MAFYGVKKRIPWIFNITQILSYLMLSTWARCSVVCWGIVENQVLREKSYDMQVCVCVTIITIIIGISAMNLVNRVFKNQQGIDSKSLRTGNMKIIWGSGMTVHDGIKAGKCKEFKEIEGERCAWTMMSKGWDIQEETGEVDGANPCRALKIMVKTLLWPRSWLEIFMSNVKPLHVLGCRRELDFCF